MSIIFQKDLCDRTWFCCNKVILFVNCFSYFDGKDKRDCKVEYTHTHMHTHTHPHTHTHTHIYIHTHIHTHARIHTHTHTHTHSNFRFHIWYQLKLISAPLWNIWTNSAWTTFWFLYVINWPMAARIKKQFDLSKSFGWFKEFHGECLHSILLKLFLKR